MKTSIRTLAFLSVVVMGLKAQTPSSPNPTPEGDIAADSPVKMERFVVTGPPALRTTKLPPQEAPPGPKLLPQVELNRALVETVLQQAKEIESLRNELKALQGRLEAIEGRRPEK